MIKKEEIVLNSAFQNDLLNLANIYRKANIIKTSKA